MGKVKNQELVVLLHGILRSSRCMRKIEKKLQQAGYATLNLDYPSMKHEIHQLADQLAEQINDAAKVHQKIHFVGHSMGGLLIRSFLHDYKVENMGRVVMIGTPNHGSEVADYLHKFWLYETLYGPAGQQLITDQSIINWWHDTIDYELGIIAGDMSLLGGGWWFITGDNDGMVSVESTKLDGMKDHITVPCLHSVMTGDTKVIAQTLAFLRGGAFVR
jgi:pimeloyl-ACP methyl ester carboxylesterase